MSYGLSGALDAMADQAGYWDHHSTATTHKEH